METQPASRSGRAPSTAVHRSRGVVLSGPCLSTSPFSSFVSRALLVHSSTGHPAVNLVCVLWEPKLPPEDAAALGLHLSSPAPAALLDAHGFVHRREVLRSLHFILRDPGPSSVRLWAAIQPPVSPMLRRRVLGEIQAPSLGDFPWLSRLCLRPHPPLLTPGTPTLVPSGFKGCFFPGPWAGSCSGPSQHHVVWEALPSSRSPHPRHLQAGLSKPLRRRSPDIVPSMAGARSPLHSPAATFSQERALRGPGHPSKLSRPFQTLRFLLRAQTLTRVYWAIR